MADKLMYMPNDDTQNNPAALAEWYTNILGMSSSQVRTTLGTSIKLWVQL